ncbi:MAG TPA: AAA family ATPase [Planctomycetota bacterium]|nr:AAA family ATPase [Planctomycetota bacterium]
MKQCRSALDEIEVLIRARYPILYIVSWEEQRVQDWLVEVAKKRNKRVFEWSYSTGVVAAGTSIQSQRPRASTTKDPLAALDHVVDQVDPALYIFKDLHPFLTRNNFAVIRRLKEIGLQLKNSYKTIILISPTMELPPELEKEVTVVDFPLPEAKDISALLDRIIQEVKQQPSLKIEIAPEARERLLKAALGLTLSEAENVFAKILVNGGRLSEEDLQSVFSEKRQIIRKSGLLDYYETDARFEQVGGLLYLKDWLRKRALAFADKARDFGLPPPKGVFLLGVQGCGKSLCAKAVSGLWGMPLLRLDVGRMFGSLVGSSEENMRRAIQVAESIAPVVLWIDEIEKAMAGSKSSGSTDSGTTARVFGTFLTWLSEKKSSVFVIATANSISELPPELLRKGRFDEIFFVDLPSDEERREIFRIHLSQRKRDPAGFDIDTLARESAGFSGAEIEEAIVSGLYDAYAENQPLTTANVEKALRETVPLSRTMEGELAKLRSWAEGRARLATPKETAVAQPPRRRIEM